MKHFVYILESNNNKYYTGYTTNINRRINQHKQGKGAKFTRSFGVKKLLHVETYLSKSKALKRESEIKKLTRLQKTVLIKTTS